MISVGFKCPISLWRNFTASLHSLRLCFSSLRFVGISPYHLSQFKVWTLTILSHAWDHKPVSGLQPILSCLTDGFIFDFIIPLCTEDFRQFPVINTAFFPDMLLLVGFECLPGQQVREIYRGQHTKMPAGGQHLKTIHPPKSMMSAPFLQVTSQSWNR